jgi:hypothetical protein
MKQKHISLNNTVEAWIEEVPGVTVENSDFLVLHCKLKKPHVETQMSSVLVGYEETVGVTMVAVKTPGIGNISLTFQELESLYLAAVDYEARRTFNDRHRN